eukprot:COSAG01_NODE_736_length_13947_cov_174.337449_14_plen_46_part_00
MKCDLSASRAAGTAAACWARWRPVAQPQDIKFMAGLLLTAAPQAM